MRDDLSVFILAFLHVIMLVITNLVFGLEMMVYMTFYVASNYIYLAARQRVLDLDKDDT